MNKSLFITILGVLSSASLNYAYPDCATNNPDDLTFYPMPECNRFYQCVGGKTYVFICREGLVFNYHEQVCDYPENVDCENQVAPPTEGPGGGEPPTNLPDCSTSDPDDITLYPMPADCNKFYQCIGGVTHVFTCMEGLVFNFQEQVCDYPENVDCQDQVAQPVEGPRSRNTDVLSTNLPDCSTNDPDDLTFYPMSECNKFYQCIGGETHVFTCQEGLVFNFQEQVCDYPENVDCDNQVAPPTEGPGDGGTDGPVTSHPDCANVDDDLYYPMSDCNKFYQCVDGYQYVFTCQEGLVFNYEAQACDYPENVDCENQVAPPTEGPGGGGTDGPATSHPDCANVDDDLYYPMSDCNKFYQCVDGYQYVFTCQEGLVFNYEAQACDYPENVDCDNQKPPNN